MRRSLIAASVTATLLLPAAAGASTLSSTPTAGTTFQGGRGSSDVTLTSGDVWSDALQTLTAGPGCTAGAGGTVSCPGGLVQVFFRDAADRFTNTFSSSDLRIHGAGGPDTIVANGATTEAWGDNGADHIDVRSNSTTRAHGGAGADELRALGNGSAMDGGDGADLVVGSTSVDNLTGDAGADQLFNVSGSFATMDGGAGNDTLVSLAVHYSGTITLTGGDGNDTIKGGTTTVDVANGGKGADVIDVYDGVDNGRIDQVTCGAGNDTVYADATDTVAADCEHVFTTAAPDLPAVDAALAHLAAAFPDTPQAPQV